MTAVAPLRFLPVRCSNPPERHGGAGPKENRPMRADDARSLALIGVGLALTTYRTDVSGGIVRVEAWQALAAYLHCGYSRAMNTTQTARRVIVIKLDKNGRRRAQYVDRWQRRMFPMPIAEADLMIATGQAVRADVHPLTGDAL